MPAPLTRRSVFTRKKSPSHVQLQERDLVVLDFVHQFRLLDRFQIVELLRALHDPDTASQHLRKRLGKLYHARYLDRIQTETPAPLYQLAHKGARRIGVRTRKSPTSQLAHMQALAAIQVAMTLSCVRHQHLKLIPWPQLLAEAPEATRRRARPMTWRVPQGSDTSSVTPDWLFTLERTDKPAGRNRLNFALEIDMGTETIRAHNKRRDFYSKLTTYHAAHPRRTKQGTTPGICQTILGDRFPNFRVLTVTRSRIHPSAPGRIKQMVACAQEIGRAGMFLFTDFATLEHHGDFFAQPWISGTGEEKRLIE